MVTCNSLYSITSLCDQGFGLQFFLEVMGIAYSTSGKIVRPQVLTFVVFALFMGVCQGF